MDWNVETAKRVWHETRDGASAVADAAGASSRDALDTTREFLEDHELRYAGLEVAKQAAKVVANGAGAVFNGLAALGEAAGGADGGASYVNYDG